LLHALQVIVQKIIPNKIPEVTENNNTGADPSTFTDVLRKLATKLIDYVDYKNA
jgi:hypothetical protein